MEEKLTAELEKPNPPLPEKVGYGKPPVSTRFQPGHAPFPGAGRPRKRPMTEEYDELLRETLPEKERKALQLPAGTTWARAMALARAREALTRGGTLAAKEITDRIEGKATQRIEAMVHTHGNEFVVSYLTPIPQDKEENIIDVVPEPEKPTEALDVEAKEILVEPPEEKPGPGR
jgi:hypothetical protein